MAASGCPDADSFSWLLGSRDQDMEDTNHNSAGSEEFHLNAVIERTGIVRRFCIKPKKSKDTNRSRWPPGRLFSLIFFYKNLFCENVEAEMN